MISGAELSSNLLASGRTADVYAVDGSRVLKLLKPGFHPLMLAVESAKTAAVRAAGVPAPAVGDQIEVEGRPGLLFERIDGPTMLEVFLSDPGKAVDFAVPFTDLHVDFLNAPASEDLPDVKEYLADKIDRADLPLAQRAQAKDHMVGLPDGEATLHGDYHPGNILLAPAGPIIIDWGEAAKGAVAADVARTLILLSPESAADVVPNPDSVSGPIARFVTAYTNSCLHRTATTTADVEAWRLPVVAARVSEDIPEQINVLQAEVARLTS